MRLRHDIQMFAARTRAAIHRARVYAILAFWALPDRAASTYYRLRGIGVRRAVLASILTVAVATPSVLYVKERARRVELSRAYRSLNFSSALEVSTLRKSMGRLMSEQAELRGLLLEAGYSVYTDNQLLVPVLATGYSSSVIETDDTPSITAANTLAHTGIVALSRDLLKPYNPDAPFAFGDVVHLSGLGDFIVEDSMNPRWHHRVDIWFPSRASAFSFGRRQVILRAPVTRPAGDATSETAYNYTLPFNLARNSTSVGTASVP